RLQEKWPSERRRARAAFAHQPYSSAAGRCRTSRSKEKVVRLTMSWSRGNAGDPGICAELVELSHIALRPLLHGNRTALARTPSGEEFACRRRWQHGRRPTERRQNRCSAANRESVPEAAKGPRNS